MSNNNFEFKTAMNEWADMDIAHYYIAISLGLIPTPDKTRPFDEFCQYKALFATNNLIGNKLAGMLDKLVDIGYLLFNEDEGQYTLNKDFKIDIGNLL